MSEHLDSAMDRVFGRVERVLQAIEAGEDPEPVVREMDRAAPWDLVAVGNAFLKDQILAEREADDEFEQFGGG